MKSLIYVPAKEKMLAKIGLLGADAYIIDLEDSIEENNKEAALMLVDKVLRESNIENTNFFVRLNSNLYEHEVCVLEKFSKVGFMLPKFECIQQYEKGKKVWEKHNTIALIETPKGVLNVESIVKCDWIDAIAFGAEDYTASVNMKNETECLLYQKSRLITYGKAYEKKVYDTPSFQLNDKVAFEKEVTMAANLGFDGKQIINPKHVPFINNCFGQFDFDFMRKIIKEYEERKEAVSVIEGVVYEQMHINRFKRILKENGGK